MEYPRLPKIGEKIVYADYAGKRHIVVCSKISACTENGHDIYFTLNKKTQSLCATWYGKNFNSWSLLDERMPKIGDKTFGWDFNEEENKRIPKPGDLVACLCSGRVVGYGIVIELNYHRNGFSVEMENGDFWSTSPDSQDDYDNYSGWSWPEDIKNVPRREARTEIGGYPVITTAGGGRHSDIPSAFHEMPAEALLKVSEVFYRGGKKYGVNNWKLISVPDHINHFVTHGFNHLTRDTTEEHLANAACRALMALQLHIENCQDKC